MDARELTPRAGVHSLSDTRPHGHFGSRWLCRRSPALVRDRWSDQSGRTHAVGRPPAGVWPLSLGTYYAFLPELMTNGDEPNLGQHVFVWSMTLSELILPVMVAAGLFGRLSGGLLIAHIWVAAASAGELFGAGRLFDSSPFDPGPDRVLLWTLALLPIAFHGAGPLSFDALIARRQGTHP